MQTHNPLTSLQPLLWDVFCQVIDNFGDIGVCWRLCVDLAARGHSVRLWVDDPSALQWMAPGAMDGTWTAIQVLPMSRCEDASALATLPPADVWVEGFGCEIATTFVASYAYSTRAGGQNSTQFPAWINLEYLSAERYVERSHGLPSPILHGPAQGWTKHFFYPGFSARTGGLLRETDLLTRQQDFADKDRRSQWLKKLGIAWSGERLVSLFCYEPTALPALLTRLNELPGPTLVLVTAGRAAAAARHATRLLPPLHQVSLTYLPTLTQVEYDQLLWACDLNGVRGEDSLVRAIWAGKPLLWQIYPQHDAAHIDKLNAFLDVLNASDSLRAIHHAWNGTDPHPSTAALPEIRLQEWSETVQSARTRLLQMDDLVTQLVDFVQKKR
ncbi:MAG TPA: elongation factor P maturation arginine rhamnosyltransferase EarP [Rhodoferax sp.]|nr:elongation factor P maturation arginine rhamnosyltransferase EarP [Rhodoferax sp.]HPW28416.1 elongation factor P maturation arginine rhamnosyltransferase EarP [Rhodoferax sp.]